MSSKQVLKMADDAQKLMTKFKSLFSAPHSELASFKMEVGKLECELASVCLDKKKRRHETMEAAARGSFMTVVEDLKLEGLACPVEWEEKKSSVTKKSPAASDGLAHRRYDENGRCTNMEDVIKARGFEVSGMAQRRDGLLGRIVSMAGEDVNLVALETGETKFASMESFISGDWKPYKPPKEQELVQWASEAPMKSMDFKLCILKAKIYDAMQEQLTSKKCEGLVHLELFKQPREVRSSKAFPVHKLMIPCATPRVDMKERGTSATGDLVVGFFENYDVVLAPLAKFPKEGESPHSGFVNPFWLVGKEEEETEESEANLEVHRCKTSCFLTCSVCMSKRYSFIYYCTYIDRYIFLP